MKSLPCIIFPSNRIRVFLVDDHTLLRQGLRSLIELATDMSVVGEAGNGRIAYALLADLRPDIIVMDIAMPLLNGVEATRQIRAIFPQIKILILSAHGEDSYIKRSIEAGAAGYVTKQTCAEVLVEAIRKIYSGGNFFSPIVAKRLQADFEKSGIKSKLSPAHIPHLTTREVEVVQLIAEGHANKQMAGTLCISIKTIEKHRQSLMDKLEIHETAGLTRYAIAEGIVESGFPLSMVG